MKKQTANAILTAVSISALLTLSAVLSGCGGRFDGGASQSPSQADTLSQNAQAGGAGGSPASRDGSADGSLASQSGDSDDSLVSQAGDSDGSLASQSGDAAGVVVFQDSLGREVTVSSPERVAAMIGSFADIWCLAGGKDSLVAAAHDTWTYFDLGLDESVADIGSTKEPNLEILAASQPDFVIASSNTEADIKILDTLEAMGINVAYFQVSNFQEYLHMLDICTQITGDRERYHQYGELLQDQIDRSKAAADGSAPTVLYVRASGSSCKVKNSRGSVLGEMLHDLGCVNIADSEDSLLEDLNMEVIVAEDPMYIFLILQGADKETVMDTLEKNLLSHPAWQSLTAVQENRCYYMEDTLYNLKPNAQWGQAYEHLARILYPDSF